MLETIADARPSHHTLDGLRRYAWVLILVADLGLMAWGLMAAIAPEHLLGPHSTPILNADYESFTGGSWKDLTANTPDTADFITLLFRMFGIGNAQFAAIAAVIAATAFRRGDTWAWWALLVGNTVAYGAPMTYDRVVGVIGPFEALEYVGIATAYVALALAHPFGTPTRTVRAPAAVS